MKLFYLDIEEYKKKIDKKELSKYLDVEINLEKRFFEYTLGRYLVKNVAKEYYEVKNTDIILNEKGKPVFKEGKLHFNISHSKNLLVVGFSEFPTGVDIEFIKDRNLDKLSKYFKKNFNNLDDFYKFWTLKEAVYKLNHPSNYEFTTKFKNDFMLSVVSTNKFNLEIIDFKTIL